MATLAIGSLAFATSCKRGWDGKRPIMCGGRQTLTLENVKATYDPGAATNIINESAITAGGDCQLTLINCDISAPVVVSTGGNAHVVIKGGHLVGTKKVAIEAGGNATITVESGHIEGKQAAIGAGGSATVDVKDGVDLSGSVMQAGSAKVTGVPKEKLTQGVVGM
jgi:hypothetical protein